MFDFGPLTLSMVQNVFFILMDRALKIGRTRRIGSSGHRYVVVWVEEISIDLEAGQTG